MISYKNLYQQRADTFAETAQNAPTEHERRTAQAQADEWAQIAAQSKSTTTPTTD
ncbi:hypothetical protein [Actinosynnema sp. ALI-1.44]|uniref:hypothetical protein n=1 Tax=Actinosynnema sp. ALI-1.44 TaxID=1933779 RepID=UPI00143D76C5|nr:hypothetical protein [Actinosynnema sp. ALI-1.44]